MKKRADPSLRVLGVMTGTSCDALDAACVEFDESGWKPLWSASSPYPSALRKRVLEIQKPKTKESLKSVIELNRDLGIWYASTLKKLIAKHPNDPPQVIANHGQTVAHFPAPGKMGATLQLGDASRIAEATGLTVVSQFRDGDMAAGGEGAPLLPLFHKLLAESLGDSAKGVAFHNIGGMSNLTYVSPKGEVLAFDTGPGNAWIDSAAELASGGKLKMDKGGAMAKKGRLDARAVTAILKNPYFSLPAPKSTGRDQFPFELLLGKTKARGLDLVTTATAITVESIAEAYENAILSKGLPLSAIFICGGGAKNPVLLDALQARLPEAAIMDLSQLGLDAQFVEAQGFAFFGFLALLGQPLGGAWTGVKSFGPPAHILPGENWGKVLAGISRFNP